MVEISQNFVVFSEYMNFKNLRASCEYPKFLATVTFLQFLNQISYFIFNSTLGNVYSYILWVENHGMNKCRTMNENLNAPLGRISPNCRLLTYFGCLQIQGLKFYTTCECVSTVSTVHSDAFLTILV